MEPKTILKEWRLILSCLFFVAIGGLADGARDTLNFHYGRSIFPQTEEETVLGKGPIFWNPDISWTNKYKAWPNDHSPAFPLSTTALVFLTDGWHLLQFIMLTCFQLAVIIPLLRITGLKWYWGLIALLPFKGAFSVGFFITYSWLLKKRQHERSI